MGVTLVQVRIPQASSLPADDIINTFHFSTAADEFGVGERGEVVDALAQFYDEAPPAGGQPLTYYFQNQLQLALAEFKFYDVTAPGSTPPYYTEVRAITNVKGSTVDLPSEVTVALSYHGDLSLPGPQSRRRGRLYLPPLNGAAVSDELTGVRVAAGLRTSLASTAERLIGAIRAIGGVITDNDWTVYSRGKGTRTDHDGNVVRPDGTLDWEPFTTDVIGGWVDNAFDTQRRRGLPSTLRTTFGPV